MRQRSRETVALVGLGYVGLSTAVCLASRGFSVLGIDTDIKKISAIMEGISPIHEKGIGPLLRASVRRKALTLSSSYEGLPRSNVIFLTVGTPSKQDGGIDTEFVEGASRQVGQNLASSRGYHLVVVKSTVTPGTTEGVVRPILERESGKKMGEGLGLASNPEFLHEGEAIKETLHPEAIVIGGIDKRSSDTLLKMYESFYRRLPPIITTSPSNAEMMKYAINAGRATQLSFVNTIANFCSRIRGCDYDEVRKGLSIVGRMDERYLGAGLGFGGSCLPKDARALASALRSAGVSDEVVSTSLKINTGQVDEAIRLAQKSLGSLEGRRVAVLGLAFKAGTDDIRESVSITLIRALITQGAEISVYDPAAMDNTRQLLRNQVTYSKSAKDCLRSSECAFVATPWDDFKELRPRDFKTRMASPVVIDGRRIYDQAGFRKNGVLMSTIGTGPSAEDHVKKPSSERAKEWRYIVKEGKVALDDET